LVKEGIVDKNRMRLFGGSYGGYASLQVVVGDSKRDRDLFMLTSPAKNTDKIKTPIFIAMGSDDVRVPLIHAKEFVKNLERSGGKVEMKVYTGEAHGFNKDENVLDFYGRLDKFFAQYIGEKK